MGENKASNESSVEYSPVLQRIGAGSFAKVYVSRGGACAFKVIHNPEDTETIEKEYRILSTIYLSCSAGSFFRLPQPYAFYDPATNALHVEPTSQRHPRPLFTTGTFRHIGITNASYAMDRVFMLPFEFSEPIRKLYYPPSFKNDSPPSLCRLYFGKTINMTSQGGGRAPRFFNSANFPIDLARYSTLAQTLALADINEVITGMGDMLARLHWRGNLDGRDIEWVLGGDGFGGVSYFVIDFNQMREWGRNMKGVAELVTAFISNDPYYPRPRLQDPHYQTFRTAYLAACPAEQGEIDIALAFLAAIEEEQAKRDAVPPGRV